MFFRRDFRPALSVAPAPPPPSTAFSGSDEAVPIISETFGLVGRGQRSVSYGSHCPSRGGEQISH